MPLLLLKSGSMECEEHWPIIVKRTHDMRYQILLFPQMALLPTIMRHLLYRLIERQPH